MRWRNFGWIVSREPVCLLRRSFVAIGLQACKCSTICSLLFYLRAIYVIFLTNLGRTGSLVPKSSDLTKCAADPLKYGRSKLLLDQRINQTNYLNTLSTNHNGIPRETCLSPGKPSGESRVWALRCADAAPLFRILHTQDLAIVKIYVIATRL
jgi:hypothetical protein